MDRAEGSGPGPGVGDVRVLAAISGTGHACAARANRVYRTGATGGLRRKDCLPARANAIGTENRPARTASSDAHADGSALPAVRRSSEAHRFAAGGNHAKERAGRDV